MRSLVNRRFVAHRLLTVVTVVAAATLGSAAAAHATAQPLPEGAGTYLACPDVQTLAPSGTYQCKSLTEAITEAEDWNNTVDNTRGNATIDLLPGQYCPVQLPYDPYPITIQGVGFAGLQNASDITSYTGFEADLSEFTWNASCTAIASDSYFLQNLLDPADSDHIWGRITLRNFSVKGASLGPSDGIEVLNADLDAQDLLTENLTDTGLTYTDNENFYDAGIQNSAFVDNGTGVNIHAGDNTGASIDESTIANNVTGVEGGGSVNLGGDTIAHNGGAMSGAIDQLSTSIVGDSTGANCTAAISDDFGENVVGSGCPNSASGDVPLTSTIGSVSTGNEITPSIQPVTEADGIVDGGICGTLDGTDQEERNVDRSSCDAGSIQPSGTTSDPTPSAAIDFGAVPTNDPATQAASITAGGGVVGISGVDVSDDTGTGSFAVTTDNCTYNLLLVREFGQGSCTVYVTATTTDTSGTSTGTLTFHTTAGDETVALTATGAPAITAAGAPTGFSAAAGNHQVNLTWTAPTDDGGIALDHYEVQDSTNAGADWEQIDTDYDTSETTLHDGILGLTDGTTYEFRVRAENGVVDGTWSDTVSATPHGPLDPSAISPAASQTISYGTSVHLTTVLTDSASGHAIGGASVKLMDRNGTSGNFSVLTTLPTDTNGIAQITEKPAHNTQYEWSYAGTSGHGSATSAPATVKVAQVITAALDKSKIKHHKAVHVFGIVLPTAAGEKVVLQLDVKGKWKPVGSATTKKQNLPNGKKALGYSVSYKPGKKGKEQLRVVRAADATNLGATSKTLKLKVT